MDTTISHKRNLLIAAILGAIGGGFVVAITTRAVSKIMQQIMPALMSGMMKQMGESGCNPQEI
jgi:hypothetical protein